MSILYRLRHLVNSPNLVCILAFCSEWIQARLFDTGLTLWDLGESGVMVLKAHVISLNRYAWASQTLQHI